MAGIGGSAVEIPLFEAFFDFNSKIATSLSGFCIMLCAIVRFIMHFSKKHPQKDSIVIDYGIAIIMLPTVLFGSFVGNYMNLTFPSLII